MPAQHALPIMVPPVPEQRWRCHSCGHCCRDLVAHLTQADRERIDAQGWSKELDRPPYVRLGGEWVLNHVAGKGCVFLRDDGKCAIHARFGFDAKPIACRIFPFVLRPLGENLQLSCRFDCPSFARSVGDPLSAHIADLKKLVPDLPDLSSHAGTISLDGTRAIGTLELHALLQSADRWLGDDDRNLTEKLLGLADIVHTLSQARLENVRDDRFEELLGLLFAQLREDPAKAEWPVPTRRQQKLFRQQVFAHCEYACFADVSGGWRSKIPRMLSQLRRSRRFSRLDGSVPASDISDREIPFRRIDGVQPAARDARRVEELVLRYVRSQLLSCSSFGPHYYGWSVIIGLQALLSRVAVWGFISRYCAADQRREEVSFEDAVRGVGIISRTAGFSRALGSRAERWRLRYMNLDHGLERLLASYPMIRPEKHPSEEAQMI